MEVHLRLTLAHNTYSGFVVRKVAFCDSDEKEAIALSSVPSEVTCPECRTYLESQLIQGLL